MLIETFPTVKKSMHQQIIKYRPDAQKENARHDETRDVLPKLFFHESQIREITHEKYRQQKRNECAHYAAFDPNINVFLLSPTIEFARVLAGFSLIMLFL